MESLNDISVWVPVFSALIPILSALAVKQDGSSFWRAVIAVVAATLLAVVDQVVNAPDGLTLSGLIVTAITALVLQVGMYLSVWKPLVNINDTALPTVGIGPKE